VFFELPVQTTPNYQFYRHSAGQPALAGISSKKLEDFVGAKLYCSHALADSNQHIRIREKMLDVSTMLSTLSPYLIQLPVHVVTKLVCAASTKMYLMVIIWLFAYELQLFNG